MLKINIAKDFAVAPGGRLREMGPFSGEEFREDILEKKYLKAKKNNSKLLIDLDGVYGYATSFLEESFGGLARLYDRDEVLDCLEFKSIEQPSLIEQIKGYIRDARKR